MQKDGSGFIKVSDKINNINNNSNHESGVFDLIALNGQNTADINLSSFVSSGTYKVVIAIYDENGNFFIKDSQNLIILD